MDVSVIICTFDRCDQLRRTLQSLESVEVPPYTTWELLIVDNNSTDRTRQIVEEFARRLPIFYLFEPVQGKSFALNRSVLEAHGDLLLFTDDDVDIEKDWIVSYANAAEKYPTAVFFGGRVIPRWDQAPPHWLQQNSATLLRNVALNIDFGANEVVLQDPLNTPVGANLGFRRSAFAATGVRFRKDLGPCGGQPVRFEESALIQELIAKGNAGIYVPHAIVYHRNGRERATERYVFEWFKGDGMAAVRLNQLPSTRNVWFGAPRYLWRQVLTSGLRYCLTRHTRKSHIWLSHLCRLGTTWGAICEFRKNSNVPEH